MTAPLSVTIDINNALARLRLTLAAAQDLSPVLGGAINKSIDTVFKRQFESEGTYGGTKWKSLAPVTLKLRSRRGHGRGGILRDMNRLWASLTKLGLGPDAHKVVSKDRLERGTTVPYARYIQTGYESKTFVVIDTQGNPIALRRRHSKHIPARQFLPDPMPTPIVNTWARYIADFVSKGA